MELTEDTIGSTPLDEFVSLIPSIYAVHDRKRNLMDVWMHTNHHAAAIGEEARKSRPGGELLKEIADFSMWFFTLIGRLQGDLGDTGANDVDSERERLIRIKHGYSDLLWNKYPWMCPVCYWRRAQGDRTKEDSEGFSRPCDCLLWDVEKRDQSQDKKHALSLLGYAEDHRKEGKPGSVDQWQTMFSIIYAANLRHLDLTDIAFHLLEELGEVSDAMAKVYTYKAEDLTDGEPRWRQLWLEHELADASSWLFALVEKVNAIPEIASEYERWTFGKDIQSRPRITLSSILWHRYGSGKIGLYCPYCKRQTDCRCPIKFCPQDVTVEDLLGKYARDLTV